MFRLLALLFFLFIFRSCCSLAGIIRRVTECEVPPFRPTVTTLIPCVEELRELMKTCWEEKPEVRPDFHDIKKSMQRILNNSGMWVGQIGSIHCPNNQTEALIDSVIKLATLLFILNVHLMKHFQWCFRLILIRWSLFCRTHEEGAETNASPVHKYFGTSTFLHVRT